ncbi:MAG: amidohydrolase family protein [Candidatus Omnitrophica bacterium]|nr:amidohydrolase family protein [Candidatus Omnitrophota bacterium]MCM8807022.1 amidohydrolase family protein [Candidatus Omnitrophota bacterium]
MEKFFIDIHVHAFKRPYVWIDGRPLFSTPEQILKKYDELGIEKGVLLPIVNSEVYLPQSNEEILEICEKYPDRFIPFCNIDPRALTNSPESNFEIILDYYKNLGCKGIGEVMPNLPFLDERVLNLFKYVEKVGFPLIFDSNGKIGNTYGLYDEPGLPQLEKCLNLFPKLKFIGHGPAFWAEISVLKNVNDRYTYPDYPVIEEGVVPKLMRKYPNLYGDLSAQSGYNALARDPEYAVKFLNEFADKLLFGTDICRPDAEVPLVSFLINLVEKGKISEKVFKKIARENVEKLLNL